MNKSTTRTSYLGLIPWMLSAVVSLLAIYVWGQSFAWNRHVVNAYLFFPILGLLAYSILWSQYMVGFLQHNALKAQNLGVYFRNTGYLVLLLIVLHPGILIYARFRDGYGLPPGSYESYVAPGMGWITLLGTVSLLAFLAFELRRFYGQKKWWKYVLAAGDAAMLAIFYHGFRLGTQLRSGWFRYLWLFYGTTLLLVLFFTYYKRLQQHGQTGSRAGSAKTR